MFILAALLSNVCSWQCYYHSYTRVILACQHFYWVRLIPFTQGGMADTKVYVVLI